MISHVLTCMFSDHVFFTMGGGIPLWISRLVKALVINSLIDTYRYGTRRECLTLIFITWPSIILCFTLMLRQHADIHINSGAHNSDWHKLVMDDLKALTRNQVRVAACCGKNLEDRRLCFLFR